MVRHILLTALLGAMPQQAQPPETPLQHRAVKALAGSYGPLSDWQRRGYTAVRDGRLSPREFCITSYYPPEPDARVDCHGRPCHPGTLASNRLPYGTVVALDGWDRLFRVTDCGSRRNDRRAGERTWVDVWLARSSEARGRCDWTRTPGVVVAR